MPFITKAARAATLEAAGVTEKLDALRRELTVAIQRAEDHVREDVAGLRDDIRAWRTEVANDRQAMLESAASDRQAMLDIAERYRKDSEADRRAMIALVECSQRDVA